MKPKIVEPCEHGNIYVCEVCGLVQEYPNPTNQNMEEI